MELFKKFSSPTFTLSKMDKIIRELEDVAVGEDLSNFQTEECKDEGLAFAFLLSQQIIGNGCKVPASVSAKHSNWLSSTEQMEKTYSLVLAHFSLTGRYDIISERIFITGVIKIS